MALVIPFAFWPLVITTGVNDKLDFTRGATPSTASIPAGTYTTVKWFSGEPQTSLQAAVESAMRTAAGFSDIIVGLNAATGTGRFQIACTGAALTLRFGTGANKAIAIHRILGYDDTDLAVGAGVDAFGQHQHQNGWYPEDPVQDDTGNLPYFQRGGRAQTVSLDGKVASYQFASRSKRAVALSFLAAHKTFIADEAAAGATNEAIERLIVSGWARFRWHTDRSNVASGAADYVLDLERMQEMPRNRYSPGLARYTLALPMLQFV